MVTVAEPSRGDDAARALHDRLESAYFRLAARSGRWFERRVPHALMGGFAGLDSSTMSRVALLTAPDPPALDAVLTEARAFFGARQYPWSVHVTPWTVPPGAGDLLRRRGFDVVSELTVMTWSPLADPPIAPDSAPEARLVPRDEMGRFTQLTIDAFGMPARFLPALKDINEAWVEAGARAYWAEVDGRPVGTALLAESDGVLGVYNVATLHRHRLKGVARALMRRVLEDARATRAEHVTLQVAKGSVAERFYRRIGFTPRYAWTLYARP